MNRPIPRLTRWWTRWHHDADTIGDRVVILLCCAAVRFSCSRSGFSMLRSDITGQHFGMLTALHMTRRNSSGAAIWLFRCECGTEKELQPSSVRCGGTISCGCYAREVRGAKREHFRDAAGIFCVALDKHMFAKIDDADIGRVIARTWYAVSRYGQNFYALTGRKSISMHRMIAGAETGQIVDHINGDSLDNRGGNLRLCNAEQNAWNRRSFGRTSQFKGVTRHRCGKWQAKISGRYLGLFDSEIAAAKAADNESRRKYGDFAWLNFGAIR